MDNAKLKELLHYIVENLVDDPSSISIDMEQQGEELTLKLKVGDSDMGKVIGRQGRIAKEIRTVLRASGQKDGLNVSVDIVD